MSAASEAAAPENPPPQDPAEAGYRWYVLAMLVLVYAFNYIDRQLLSVLLDPIKTEFGATDAQMGFLGGFVFALVYTTAGIPVARLADAWVRRSVIAWALAVWSGMTAATSLAGNFTQLTLARVGVALGEAGGTPPSHALLSDYFPPERRATVLGLFSLGIPIGTFVGLSLGGWIGQEFGWRSAFIWLGLPGIALALIVRFTVREPGRGVFDSEASKAAADDTTLMDVFRFMFSLPSFRWFVPAISLAAFSGYGFAVWKPAFLGRVHDFSLAEAGLTIGVLTGLTGIISTPLGGWLTDRWGDRDPAIGLKICAASVALALPFQYCFVLWPDPVWAIALFIPGGLIGGLWQAPTYAATQNLAKPHMRALASAILLFFLNLIGLGFGPWAIGALSDWLAPQYGAESIRWALAIGLGANILGAVCYWKAARTYVQDLEVKDRIGSDA